MSRRTPQLLARSASDPRPRSAPRRGRLDQRGRRPVVDLPQPDSPTRPSVSPAAIAKLTPSTARTVDVRPTSSPVTGSPCRDRTSSSVPSAVTAPPPRRGAASARRVRSTRTVRRPALAQRRAFSGCTSPCRSQAARREPAARRRASGRRPRRRSPSAARARRALEPGQRAEQRLGVGVLRRAEQGGGRRPSTIRPAYITTTSSADSGDDAEVVGDQHSASRVPRSARRAGRGSAPGPSRRARCGLVGDQQLRLARERHRDHHPLAHAAGEAGAGSRRAAVRRPGCRLAEQLDGPLSAPPASTPRWRRIGSVTGSRS